MCVPLEDFAFNKKYSNHVSNPARAPPPLLFTFDDDHHHHHRGGDDDDDDEEHRPPRETFTGAEQEEHKNLTRFQIRDPRSKCLGKTCVFRDLEDDNDRADVKRMVERDVGEKKDAEKR